MKLTTKQTAVLIGVFCVLFSALVSSYFIVFTSKGNFVIWDFQPTRVAARELLRGRDPYSDQVTEIIQREAYGRLPTGEEDVHAFAYPIFLAYLAIPFGLLPRPWAQAVWLSILLVIIVGSVLVILHLLNWPRNRFARLTIIMGSLLFYPLVWSFILGQIALIVYGLLVLTIFGLRRDWDVLAGLTMGLSLIKPNLVFLIIPGLVIWGILQRRRRFIISSGATVLILILVPTILQPGWINDYRVRLLEYADYSPFPTPALIPIERCCPSVASWVGPAIIGIFLAAVVYGWVRASKDDHLPDILWAVGISLIATTAIAPRIAIVNQCILLLPILFALRGLSMNGRWGQGLAFMLVLICGVGLWVFSMLPPVSTAQPRYPVEHLVLAPIIPLTAGVVYIFAHPWITKTPSRDVSS
jgi:hypothetical protein